MKVVITTRGSRGDVHPFLTIAEALGARGHDVRVCLPDTFVPEARRRGIAARGNAEDSQEIMRGFGHGPASLRTVLRWFARSIDEQFDYLLDETRDADVLVAATSEIASASIAEYRTIPFVRVTFAPMMTGYRSNALLPWQGLPPALNRAGWSAINAGVDLMAFAPMRRWRSSLGLPLLVGVGDHLARHGLSMLSCSPVLCEPCPSWQGRYRYQIGGYPHDGTVEPLPADVLEFLEAGEPPIYVGLGSVSVGEPGQISAMVRDAALQIGARVVLGAGWTGLGAELASRYVHVVGDVDHQALFPRMRGIIHHGGSGTTHSAARAGVPQLILPQLADQFYWGHRIAELGIGPEPMVPKRLTTGRLARAMRALADDASVTLQAARVGRVVRQERGVRAAVDAIEAAVGTPSRPSTGTPVRAEAVAASR